MDTIQTLSRLGFSKTFERCIKDGRKDGCMRRVKKECLIFLPNNPCHVDVDRDFPARQLTIPFSVQATHVSDVIEATSAVSSLMTQNSHPTHG